MIEAEQTSRPRDWGAGRAVSAALTLLLVLAAIGNGVQRNTVIRPDDGVVWAEAAGEVRALRVERGGAGERAGLRAGDRLLSIDKRAIVRATEVDAALEAAGAWNRAVYELDRDGTRFSAEIVVGEAPRRAASGAFRAILGVAYLSIGSFVLYRRRRAPMAGLFHVFCLSSFALYTLSYTGELDLLDRVVYWANVWATALTPALFLHFCLAYPRGELSARGRAAAAAAYALAGLAIVATQAAAAGWLRTDGPLVALRENLDRLTYALLGIEFLAGALILRYGQRPNDPVEAQQRRWLAYGAFWGVLPFCVFYILPFVLGRIPGPNHTLSIFSLALIPASFLFAAARHRFMDVDLVFRRGAAYTLAAAAVLAAFYGAVFVASGWIEPETAGLGPAAWVASVIGTALVFQPLRAAIQRFLDRRRFRERFDYRRALADFAAELGAENDPERMLDAVAERIERALDVERLVIFVRDDAERFRAARSRAMTAADGDWGFLDRRPPSGPGPRYLFFPNPAWNQHPDDQAREAIAALDLNYFVPCAIRGRAIAWIGLGRTRTGEYLTSEDLALVEAISGAFAIGLENARLYRSLERKASEYQRLKDYNENIVESLHVGILAVDLDDRVESWNTQLELLFGISRGDSVGRKLDELLPAELARRCAEARHDSEVRTIYRFVVRAQDFPEPFRPAADSRDGLGERVLNIAIAPLVAKNFEPIGRLIILDDVTERTALEEQVAQADKLSSIGLLAAGVAHEVNTPLAVISSYAQMLAKQAAGDPAQARALEKITSQTFRASEIVNSLLNFSRTASNEFAPVDVEPLLRDTLALVEPQLRKARIEVETAFEPGLPAVRGVAGKLQQVFLNLVLNARDAMPEGGRLAARARRASSPDGEETVRIEIADSGPGIPRELLGRIFDPFFTTKGPKKGTGLGLSVSYGIIKEHGGDLRAESAPGRGATFVIELTPARKPVHA